ncbi:MAG TPA: S41 family peptidase [Thermoanaerobaculia bacterium]|jgi:carboxyl-terminal processing protease|nr:S41 family peptidase [Thermoanaerobaculia bacterium]
MKSNRSRLVFLLVSVAALASLRAVDSGAGRDPATKALSVFSEVFSLTRGNYVDPTDSKALLEGAYDGMTDALDPYSYYVPAASMPAYRAQQASGALSPGIIVARRGGFPYVVASLPGSPAQKAGVQPGDLIHAVDGKNLRTAPLWKIRSALDGPEGTSVEVGLFRFVEEKKVTLRLRRERFSPPAIETRWEKDLAIVKIPAITPATSEGLARVIEEANKRSIDKLILDLRGAIGGETADAAPAASLFIGRGPVARLVTRKVALKPLDATGERAWKGRTILLIDDATGGPAEIFAAALKDRAGATTVGETTAGLAIVQRLVPTGSGGSLYMTVARYQSPSGTLLGGKGLSPDERVITFPGETDGRDPILERGLEVARRTAARQAA